MTDREIIETILEQKGNDLRTRLIEYINLVDFHDYDKNKKIHLCPGAEKELDFNNLIDGAEKILKKADEVWFVINYKGIPSADFIVRYGEVYKYVEQKSITSIKSLKKEIDDAIIQAHRFLLNIKDPKFSHKHISSILTNCFKEHSELSEIILVQGGKYISINRSEAESKNFYKWLRKSWG